MRTGNAVYIVSALALVPLAASAAAEPAPPFAPPAKPNIIVILADDLGYGDVHCLNPGHGKILTPNIDKLAAQGMAFTDAHGSSSVCTPSRYSLLTGRYNWRTRLQNGVLNIDSPALIAADRITLPKLLRQQGYQTAGMGKWHLGLTLPVKDQRLQVDQPIANGPETRGFDAYLSSDNRLFPPFMFTENGRFVGTPLLKETRVGLKYGQGTSLKMDDFAHILPAVTDKAVKTIESLAAKQKPFFIYYAPSTPHDPFVPTPEWKGKSGLGVYADYVMELDFEVGRLLAALDKTGQADNTIVIFTSDNGCAPYSGSKSCSASGYARYDGVAGMKAQGHFPSAQFRGYKSDTWDGGHRIPFIVRWPGVVKPGATCAQLVGQIDLLATCAEITGVKLADNAAEDSLSLLSLLKGGGQPVRDTLVHHSFNGRFSIREGQWKLILCAGSGGWGAPPKVAKGEKLPEVQLYNMSVDEGEQKNLQAEHPEIVKRLTEKLEKLVAEGRSTPGTPQKNDVPIDIFKKGK
jgi:arylsulfatase A-like enzyme